jgi:hypothetical protein
VTRAEAARIVTLTAQAEMALVRRDPVAGPLLAQAARAADGLPPAPVLAAAAALARGDDPTDDAPASAARRKVVQALCRAGAQVAVGDLLAPAAGADP